MITQLLPSKSSISPSFGQPKLEHSRKGILGNVVLSFTEHSQPYLVPGEKPESISLQKAEGQIIIIFFIIIIITIVNIHIALLMYHTLTKVLTHSK